MAVWLPAQNKFYLPPQPVTRIVSTDEYVHRTDTFYHASSDRLLTVGHPYYEILDSSNKVVVPKVSPNQYRVFRVRLPNPNNFAFGDKCMFDPEQERLVWACRGVEVSRGGPLGLPVSGNPLFNKYTDTENPFAYPNTSPGDTTKDNRMNVSMDPKQTQVLIVGCKPAMGEHWKKSAFCSGTDPAPATGACPPIELEHTPIQDGDMMELGIGNMDFTTLQEDKASAPVDVSATVSKYPDFIGMADSLYGDELFFFSRREAVYARHLFARSGVQGEKLPTGLLLGADADPQKSNQTVNYYAQPSGSLVTSESQLFNRPYWIQRAQGHNNGVAWHNELFVTVGDNTRGTIMTITMAKDDSSRTGNYKPGNFFTYLRHVEEFQVSLILQLCKVRLTPENLAFVHTMDPTIIDEWHLAVNAPSQALQERYRYIASQATKCPDSLVPVEPPDPYKDMKFWTLDLSERLTEQLDQTALGRKFLFQSGLMARVSGQRVSVPRAPRCRTRPTGSKAPPRKRRRTCK